MAENIIAGRALVVGLARDCASRLPPTLARIDRLRNGFEAANCLFITNDSADDTESILAAWVAERPGTRLEVLDGLAERHPRRGDRIAAARNAYLRHLEADRARGEPYDYLVVVDMDGVNADLVDDGTIAEALRTAPPDWGGLFANQRTVYYDLWALRHPTWCPDDCWSHVDEVRRSLFFRRRRVATAEKRYVHSRMVHIPPEEPPIAVSSAFGGFGIYKVEYLRGAVYSGSNSDGTPACEHVAFNHRVRANGGELYISPALLNDAPAEHTERACGKGAPWRSNELGLN